MSQIDDIMAESGYISAAKAADVLGFANVASVHKRLARGTIQGIRWADRWWFVSVKSLLEAYADVPPIRARIEALPVKPSDKEPPLPTRAKR